MNTPSSNEVQQTDEQLRKQRKQKLLGAVFLATVGGTSAVLGFSLAAASSAKSMTKQGKISSAAVDMGAMGLGVRALGWGTLYAVGGVGLLTIGVCTLLGVRNVHEFRHKMETFFKSHVPDIPRNKVQGKSDFGSFRELFQYLADNESSRQQQHVPANHLSFVNNNKSEESEKPKE